jgi:hypothetical protein
MNWERQLYIRRKHLIITEHCDMCSENVILPALVACLWNDLKSVAWLDRMHPLAKRLIAIFKVPFDLVLPRFTNCMGIIQQLPAWNTVTS